MIYTFWEGDMPAYIKLCIATWKLPFKVLNYKNYPVSDEVKKFTLPQVADYVRVHVLRDEGGYWLDADTIMLSDELPKENIAGDIETRSNSIGFLHTEKQSEMFTAWADYQDRVIADKVKNTWDLLGNAFTDKYVKEHKEITIHDITDYQPERKLPVNMTRYDKYIKYYFESGYTLDKISAKTMLMLHNSWTPKGFKNLSEYGVLNTGCTLSNILKELV